MANAAKDIYTTIDELVTTMGTAASHREKIEQEISDLESELSACDTMLDDAADREEYDKIMSARKECELDLKFAKNRLRRFNQSPRIDTETLDGLLSQLSAEVDSAAEVYRQKVEKPLGEIVAAGDDFDATIDRTRDAARKLHAVLGPIDKLDYPFPRLFYIFEQREVRSRAYRDGTIVYPGLRDALNLANTAKQPAFDTH